MNDEERGRQLLNDYSHRASGQMMDEWMELAKMLIVKYNDMAVKAVDDDGRYRKTVGGQPVPVERPGYPDAMRRRIAKEEGTRYIMP